MTPRTDPETTVPMNRQEVEGQIRSLLDALTADERVTRALALREDLQTIIPITAIPSPEKPRIASFVEMASTALAMETLAPLQGQTEQPDRMVESLVRAAEACGLSRQTMAVAQDNIVSAAIQNVARSLAHLVEHLQLPQASINELLRARIQSLRASLVKPAYVKAAEERAKEQNISTEDVLKEETEKIRRAVMTYK